MQTLYSGARLRAQIQILVLIYRFRQNGFLLQTEDLYS